MSLPPNPTPNANYLVSEQIMFGWYPGSPDDNSPTSNSIEAILKTERDVFVNVTSVPERSCYTNYVPNVLQSVPNPIFLYYPINDSQIPEDMDSFRKFIALLHVLIKSEKKLYVHCRGGHGRSAIVCACLLIDMGYSTDEALRLISEAHKTRTYIPDYPCPQTPQQADFIRLYESK